jgi:hypothetical protein
LVNKAEYHSNQEQQSKSHKARFYIHNQPNKNYFCTTLN